MTDSTFPGRIHPDRESLFPDIKLTRTLPFLLMIVLVFAENNMVSVQVAILSAAWSKIVRQRGALIALMVRGAGELSEVGQ